MYIIDTLYDALGHTGNTYYVRFVEADTNQIYDAVAKALVDLPTWEDSSIKLVEKDSTGQFPVICPIELPKGHRYDCLVHKMAGSLPVNTDDVTKQSTFTLGSFFGF